MKSKLIRISLTAFSLLFFTLPLTFGQREEELKIKLPPAVIIGEERMKIIDARVPPLPTVITLEAKEEPMVDPRGLSEEVVREIEKTSPVAKSPGCAYSTDVTASFAKLFKGVEALYKRAKYHYHKGEYTKAWGTFEELLEKYPQSPYVPSTLYWMGEIRWHQGRKREALTLYQRVIQEFPEGEFTDYALYSAGWISLKLADPTSAHDLFSRLRQRHPRSPVALLGVFWDGYALMKIGRWEESVSLFNQIISSKAPSSLMGEALYLKGVCLFVLQRYGEALSATTNFIDGYPSHPLLGGGMYIKGWCSVYLQQYTEALQSFDAYLQHFKGGEWQDPVIWGKVKAWLGLGELDQALTVYQGLTARDPCSLWGDNALNEIALYHFRHGEYAKATKAYQDLLQEYPESEIKDVVYLRLGESFYRCQQYTKAAQVWERLLQESPSHPRRSEVSYWLGETYLMLDEYPKGQEYLLRTHGDPHIFPQALLALGWYNFDKGKWDEALKIFQDLLKMTPSGPVAQRAMLLMGETLFNQKKYGKATQVFKKLSTQEGVPRPLRGRVVFYQGLTHYKKGEFPLAVDRFLYLLNQFPHHPLCPEALFWLGWSYFRQKEFTRAIEVFSRLVKEGPRHHLAPKALMKIGDSYYNLEKPLKAVVSYLKVIKDHPKAPEVPEAEWGVILSFYRGGKYDNFKEWSEAFLQRHPVHPVGVNVLLLLGDFYRHRADRAQAAKTYRRIITNYPTLPLADEARLRWAELLLQMGRSMEAAKVLKGVSSRGDNPYYPQAIFQLGEIHFQKGEYREAIAYYEELMRMGGVGVAERGWLRAVMAYQATGRPEKALQVLREFVTSYPGGDLAGDAWLKMGEIYLGDGKYQDALVAYKKALGCEKRQVKALAQLGIGESYLKLKDKGTALTELMRVHYLYPEQKGTAVRALLQAGEIYVEREEWDEAAQVYRKVLTFSPQGEEGKKAREMLKRIDEKGRRKKREEKD
ncbi:MAG: tetratricopeptide repeat protein [Deltaproteobacteria bacterium]|nr:tetratricopeptide repeat protein [Deltaproteobacteria bacterium]